VCIFSCPYASLSVKSVKSSRFNIQTKFQLEESVQETTIRIDKVIFSENIV